MTAVFFLKTVLRDLILRLFFRALHGISAYLTDCLRTFKLLPVMDLCDKTASITEYDPDRNIIRICLSVPDENFRVLGRPGR